jgi:hypothetical protein
MVVIQGLLIFGGSCTGADRPSTSTQVNDDKNENGFECDKYRNESYLRAKQKSGCRRCGDA